MRGAGADVLLDVWVMPGAKRSEIVGVIEGRLRLRLAAPAREGRANDELVRFLAKILGKRRSDITVELGGSARRKLVRVAAATSTDVAAQLGL